MKKKKSQGFSISIPHIKILETIHYLNDLSFYPTPTGVRKMLNGVVDEDTKPFIECPTFATLISIQGRKLCSYIHVLVRRGYLTYKFDKKSEDLYLSILDLGKATLITYYKEHAVSYHGHKINKKPSIVKIED